MTETPLKEVKTDATESLAHTNEEIAKLETSASGWIKTHVAWIWGLGGLFVGYIVGHLHH